jgi:hypothetical protein
MYLQEMEEGCLFSKMFLYVLCFEIQNPFYADTMLDLDTANVEFFKLYLI